MRRLDFLKLLVAILFLFSTGLSFAGNGNKDPQPQTIKVLTIGNSFANNVCQYLKQITESVEGCDIVIGKANLGGCSLERHADLIKKSEQDPTFKPYGGKSLKELLQQDDWDVVTIQQVSHLSFKAETYQPYADEISAFVKKYAPHAKVYIHETWPYAPDCPRLEGFGITSDQMYKGLKKNYKVLSKRYNSPILPSGDAFYRSFKKNKGIDLWNEKDRFHASFNGCYLAGCVWFGKLFGRSPKEVTFIPDGITEESAKFLQAIAEKIDS